mgnify:CR=1 FL=1
MPRMSEQNRAIAIGLLEANFSVKAVARRMGVTPKAIRKLRERFQNTQEVKDRPRTGRPRVTTARQDRLMANIALRRRTMTGGPFYLIFLLFNFFMVNLI